MAQRTTAPVARITRHGVSIGDFRRCRNDLDFAVAARFANTAKLWRRRSRCREDT
jgi:hypothetical protein